jgi:DNA replication protein DnaD
MKITLKHSPLHTLVPAEILEIYQPLLGYRSISVWLNLYHALLTFGSVSEADLIQQMNISKKDFQDALTELGHWDMVSNSKGARLLDYPLTAKEILAETHLPCDQGEKLKAQARAFFQRRGVNIDEVAPKHIPGISEQEADELATRFIKECGFSPTKQLRERFDLWFEQIRDIRLLEELLSRTKRKLDAEGNKGGCPSTYADHIVRQWLIQGITSFEDLARHDRDFQLRSQCYRGVEKELGRSYNTITPSEREIVDGWLHRLGSPEAVAKAVAAVILSGEWQGKGLPGMAFINKVLSGSKPEGKTQGKKNFAHQHSRDDLQQAIRRKTRLGLEESRDEG